MKRILLTLVLGLSVLAAATGQQQFAKTGVVNIPALIQAYKTAVNKSLETLKASIQKDIDRAKDEIRVLGDQRSEAQKKGDQARVQELTTLLQAKTDAFAEFGQQKQLELQAALESAKNDTTFQKLLPQEIEYAGRAKGFSLILNAANPSVSWWADDIDITVEVANRLSADLGLVIEIKPNPTL